MLTGCCDTMPAVQAYLFLYFLCQPIQQSNHYLTQPRPFQFSFEFICCFNEFLIIEPVLQSLSDVPPVIDLVQSVISWNVVPTFRIYVFNSHGYHAFFCKFFKNSTRYVSLSVAFMYCLSYGFPIAYGFLFFSSRWK